MGPNGCKWMFEMLHVNTGLRELDLSSNDFGDKIGDYIADALRVSKAFCN